MSLLSRDDCGRTVAEQGLPKSRDVRYEVRKFEHNALEVTKRSSDYHVG